MKPLNEIKHALRKVDRFKSIKTGFKGFLLGLFWYLSVDSFLMVN